MTHTTPTLTVKIAHREWQWSAGLPWGGGAAAAAPSTRAQRAHSRAAGEGGDEGDRGRSDARDRSSFGVRRRSTRSTIRATDRLREKRRCPAALLAAQRPQMARQGVT